MFQSPDRNVARLIGGFLVVSVVGGFIGAALALPAVGASGVLAKASGDYFESLPADLAVNPQAEITRVLAADGSLITTSSMRTGTSRH